MPLHFSSPHCRDVIEIRTAPGSPAVGCIRIEAGQYRLFGVKGEKLELLALFGALGEAKTWAERPWSRSLPHQEAQEGCSTKRKQHAP